MIKVYCDRCGTELVDIEHQYEVVVTRRTAFTTDHYNFCERCKAEVFDKVFELIEPDAIAERTPLVECIVSHLDEIEASFAAGRAGAPRYASWSVGVKDLRDELSGKYGMTVETGEKLSCKLKYLAAALESREGITVERWRTNKTRGYTFKRPII